MKNIIFTCIVILACISSVFSQVYRDTGIQMVLNGVIHEKGTYHPVPYAKIAVKGTKIEIYADGQGFFIIPYFPGLDGGKYWLQITAEDFETLDLPVEIGGVQELGIIFMTPTQRDINPITVNDLRAAGSDVRNQTFSESGTSALLLGTNDALVKASNYQLGILGTRLRGYEWNNTDVYFNGVYMNEAETDYASPQLWNGLNDAMVKAEGSYGLNSTLLYHGNLAGVSNIRIRPSEFRKRFKLSYAFSNSLYNHRLMATYTTGTMDNGWSILVSASGRLGNGFIDGTKYEALSYLLVAEKEIDTDQSLLLTVVGAPTKRGMQNYASQEAYDIADDVYYNSAWGNYNGKKQSAKTHSFHQPLISLSHNWDINDWTLLRTTAGFTFGKNSETGLFWTSAADDPRPDTYDKLSSTFNQPDRQQIGWEDIINTPETTGLQQAAYILGAQHADRWTASLNSIYDNEISETLVTTAGVQARMSKYSFYNKVDDLLGYDYWRDVDKFTSSETVGGSFYQNDLNHPDRDVKNGDRFGYDYSISQIDFTIWNRWTMAWRKWNFTATASASYTSFWRYGNMRNGKFPETSEGKSDNQNFFNFTAKGGVTYPLFNGTIEGNGVYMTRAPQFRNAFSLQQISNSTLEGLKSEVIFGGEINYYQPGAFADFRITAFYTQFNKQNRIRYYYDGDFQSLFSMMLTGLNQRHFGGELSADFKLSPGVTVKAAATYGVYKYSSDPTATLLQQNTTDIIYNDTVQISGKYVAGTPQMALTAGILYDSPKKWWAGANLNFAGNNYAEFNPMRYSRNVYDENRGYYEHEQEKLSSAFTVDIYGGYTFELGNNYLGININAHNLLGNKGFIGAYEPLVKYSPEDNPAKHATRYAYIYGRTIFLIISFRF